MRISAAQVRQQFVDFFVQRDHVMVPGASVVPHDDPTLLFTNAGMNQFKPLFLGTASRESEFGRLRRAANSQACIRAGGKHNDLDDVGRDTYHHTCFEMLGNWSFGDYFKQEAISWAWELITGVWGLDARRLHATYFGGDAGEGLAPDHEARDLWCGVAGMSPQRVHPGNKKDNFWEMGDTGPCGPCSELHVDLTPDLSGGPLVNQGDARVIEVWNLVFIQFNRGPDGRLAPLPARHVDTGMGLERIAAVLQGHNNNYATDVFTPIIAAIEGLTGHRYGGVEGDARFAVFRSDHMADMACRVIADHIRTLAFALSDGAAPDKEGRGYVLRRILRRAVRYGWQYLNLREPFLCRLADTVSDVLGDAFPTLRKQPQRVRDLLQEEEQSFARTLDRGITLFNEAATRARTDHHSEIRGADAFRLHDTFGFPIDLTQIMAGEQDLRVDIGEYERLMEDARQRARAAGAGAAGAIHLPAELVTGGGATDDHFKHEADVLEGAAVRRVLLLPQQGDAVVLDGGAVLEAGQRGALVLDKTCFYAEQGGQVGDSGVVRAEDGARFDVFATLRFGDSVAHLGVVAAGQFSAGLRVALEVNAARRLTRSNHTATHLLNLALRATLGGHIDQKGSLVDPERTRFDFSHPQSLSADQLARVEQLVNEQIAADLVVHAKEADQAAARKINTLRAVFGEKYPDRVRVVSIGPAVDDLLSAPDDPRWMQYSVEFCGGTHVRSTQEIQRFVITGEEAVAKGIRRVVALSQDAARVAVQAGEDAARLLAQARKADVAQAAELAAQLQQIMTERALPIGVRATLRDGLAELQQAMRQVSKQQEAAGADALKQQVHALLDNAERIGSVTLLAAELPDVALDLLKMGADIVKQKSGSAAVLFGVRQAGEDGSGKALLLASVSDDLIKRGVKAGDWIKAIAPLIEGGGGGPPTMAQAGGKRPDLLPEALEAGRAWLRGKLG